MNELNQGQYRAGSPVLAAAVSAVLAGASSPAAAQSETALGEVIVTATRRAERLQDVPESISALDARAISMRGLQQMDDFAKLIPGLSLGVREPGGTTVVFRGVASSGLQFGAVSSSALYLDEQPITQSGRSPDPRLIDIERVEALRGPQGTLYGASSQSGTLRVITNKPNTSAFEAWTEAQFTSVDGGGTGYDVSAMVNVPLVEDKLALRLVGFAAEDAGFIDNVLADSQGGTFDNSGRVDKDVNSAETVGGRLALRMSFTDNVEAILSGVIQDLSTDGHGDVNLSDEDIGRSLGDLDQVRFEDESLDDRWYQLALTVNASLPFADAIFSASYFDRKFSYEADASDYEFSFQSSGYVIYDFGGDPRGYATNNEDTEITTFEARLQSKADSDSRWGWLVGAFYSKETGHTEFDSYVRDYQDSPAFAYFSYLEYNVYNGVLAPTERWFLGRYDTELEQTAVFGELSYDVTENFTITAGARYYDYKRKFGQHQESPEGFSGFSLLDSQQNTDEDGTVGKVNFTYRIDDDRLVYATWSEGFRVGGSNPLKESSILPQDYSSDNLENFEVGAKTEWLDNRLRFNIAAYLMKWDDFAVQIEDPQQAIFQLGYVNLPSAEIPGVEAEFAFKVNDAWQIEGSVTYNDAHVSQATTLTLVDEGGTTYEFDVTDGARLPLTPDWSATLGIEFRPRGQLLNAQPFARFDFAYVGDSVNNLEGIESVVAPSGVQDLDSYQTGDLRLGLEGERWSGSFFVDNVWDERANLFLSNRWALQRQSVNRPRTFGLQFRYEF
jgi:outer membrane receptor protein involved in Fe transport